MQRPPIRILVIGSIVAAAFVLCLSGITDSWGGRTDRDMSDVKKVYDGDTVSVRIAGRAEKIRLIGIDAPEMGQRPWGRRAKGHLTELLASSAWSVVIEYDVERRDKYGRILAYLWLKNGKMLNEEMVRDGYAVLFTFPPNVKYAGRFTAAQEYARNRRFGLWGEKGLRERPVDYRKSHPRTG